MPSTEKDQPPRTGWQAMRAAVRWRYTEPEYKAVIASLLSDRPVEECVDTALQARHAALDCAPTGLVDSERARVEILGVGGDR